MMNSLSNRPASSSPRQQKNEPHSSVRHLVAIDAGLPDLDVLLRHMPSGSAVCLLPPHAEALDHLAQAAAQLPRSSLHGMHILGHGKPGRMQVGAGRVDARSGQTAGEAMNRSNAGVTDNEKGSH